MLTFHGFGGYIGVDVFFVISGFLITTHIVRLLEMRQLKFTTFWSRRIRRLIPASWATAATATVIGVFLFPPLNIPSMLKEAAATFAYVPNVLFAYKGTQYLTNETPSIFQHYWSLGIEEQFYFIWPILLFVAYKLFKGNLKNLLWTTICLSLTSFLLGWWMTSYCQPWAFFLLPTRAWELGIGAVLAIALIKNSFLNKKRPWKPAITWVGLVTICACAFIFDKNTSFPGWEAFIPTIGSTLVILGGTGYVNGFIFRTLSTAPMLFIGKISYSIYLVHWPLIIIPQTAVGWENPFTMPFKLAIASLAFPLGYLSWRYIEEPFRNARLWGGSRCNRPLFTAMAGATALAIITIGTGMWFHAKPLHSNLSAKPVQVKQNPIGTTYVPSNTRHTLWDTNILDVNRTCNADLDVFEPEECAFGTNHEAPNVILWGDSHANNWFPALKNLADMGEIRLEKYVKHSCSPASMPANRLTGEPYPECDKYNLSVLKKIKRHPPA